MFFFPYRADIDLHRWPLLTLLLVTACLAIYLLQHLNRQEIAQASHTFCGQKQPRDFRLAARAVFGDASPQRCLQLLYGMHTAQRPERFAADALVAADPLAGLDAASSRAYLHKALTDHYQRYASAVPEDLTRSLWYYPDSWNVLRMLSAALAHGGWMHVLGNLAFLFAFAITMEMVLGGALFVVVLAALAILSHGVYSVATIGVAEALPTVGLSGVVFGMMGLFAFFLPRTKIRCFAWFGVFFKRFSIPAWTLVGGFVALDVYRLFADAGSTINFAAHVGGAAFGYLIGVAFLRDRRRKVRAIVAGVAQPGAPAAVARHWSEQRRRRW